MGNGTVKELALDEVEQYSDGSRLEEMTAGASAARGEYLESMATMADGEALGVTIAWEEGQKWWHWTAKG